MTILELEEELKKARAAGCGDNSPVKVFLEAEKVSLDLWEARVLLWNNRRVLVIDAEL